MEPLLAVISCSSSAEDIALREGLEKQLQSLVRQGLVRVWHAGHVRAGEITSEVTLRKIREARLFLALISPDYLASADHEHELKTAIAMSARARLLPVMLRSCTLHGTPLAPMKLLPEGGLPVTRWTLPDDAWASVARAVRAAVDEIRAGQAHYAPVDVLRTAPMGPSLTQHQTPIAPAIEVEGDPFRPTPISVSPAPAATSSRRRPAGPVSGEGQRSSYPHGGSGGSMSGEGQRSSYPNSGRGGGPVSGEGQRSSYPYEGNGGGPVSGDGQRSSSPNSGHGGGPVSGEGQRSSSLHGVPVPSMREGRASGERGRSGALRAVLLLFGGALVATLAIKCSALLPSPVAGASPVTPPDPRPVPQAPAPATVCCGGVDCAASERRTAGSICEQAPGLCATCASGRHRVEGACANSLSEAATYRLRAGQVVLAGKSAHHSATVCMRPSGAAEPPTCATLNEARAGKAPPHPFPIPLAALLSGPGVDFWIEQGGLLLASERGARIKGSSLLASGLCVGVQLHGAPGSGNVLTVYLDDP